MRALLGAWKMVSIGPITDHFPHRSMFMQRISSNIGCSTASTLVFSTSLCRCRTAILASIQRQRASVGSCNLWRLRVRTWMFDIDGRAASLRNTFLDHESTTEDCPTNPKVPACNCQHPPAAQACVTVSFDLLMGQTVIASPSPWLDIVLPISTSLLIILACFAKIHTPSFQYNSFIKPFLSCFFHPRNHILSIIASPPLSLISKST